MMRLVVLLTLVLGLAACGGNRGGLLNTGVGKGLRAEPTTFDGIRFRAKVDFDKEDRRAFTVTVQKASQNIEAALDAGNFEAVKYCLGAFGASDAEWTIGPDQDPETVEVSESDTLTLAGRCTKR